MTASHPLADNLRVAATACKRPVSLGRCLAKSRPAVHDPFADIALVGVDGPVKGKPLRGDGLLGGRLGPIQKRIVVVCRITGFGGRWLLGNLFR